jgi:hypothetical protein
MFCAWLKVFGNILYVHSVQGFWASFAARNSEHQKTQRFGNSICFCPQMKGGRRLLQLHYSSILCMLLHNFYRMFSCYTSLTGVRSLCSSCYMTLVAQCLKLALSSKSNSVGVSFLHLKKESYLVSVTLGFLVPRITDDG